MRRAQLVRAVLLIGVLALGACGRDTGSSDTGSSDVGSPTTPATASAVISGVVVDGSGQPVDGALVQPKSLDDPPRPVPEMAVFSGPDGRYEWHLTAGRYEFSATKDDRKGTPSEVTAPAGGTEQLELRLP